MEHEVQHQPSIGDDVPLPIPFSVAAATFIRQKSSEEEPQRGLTVSADDTRSGLTTWTDD